MSDIFWNGLFICIATVVVAYFQMRTKNAVIDTGAKAAAKTEEVRVTLEEATTTTDNKLVAMAVVVDDTHTLVNSNMEKVLLIAAIALRRVADDHPEDVAAQDAAKVADASLSEHRKKQKIVDQGMKIAPDSSLVEHDHKEAVKETLADVKEVKQDVKDLKAKPSP